MIKTLIIDNFDSFTYNLYQYVAELSGNPEVHRNDAITLAQIRTGGYTHIIISPGPGSPNKKKDFGVCAEVIKKLSGETPVLGVCLGHQGIIHYLGGEVGRAPAPVHGKQSVVALTSTVDKIPGCAFPNIFAGLPKKITAMRYHSLIGEKKSLPKELVITGETEKDHLVMAVQHLRYPLYGVQFHPESIGTPEGKKILKNFLSVRGEAESGDKSMTEKEAEAKLYEMASRKMPADEMSALLRTMAKRGETVAEIVGMARGMRKSAVKIPLHTKAPHAVGPLMDTCGTGGSGLVRMNISTAVAFVLAAAGVKIAKHGNRAAGGRCGSFDLLEALGVEIELSAHEVASCIENVGIGCMYAPLFHPAMKAIGPVRKALGIRTIFNLLGPLTNPATPAYHMLGVTSTEIAQKMIHAMRALKYTRALVVSGADGLDEATLTGTTHIYELKNGKITSYDFSPEEAGLTRVSDFREIAGGDAQHNANLFIALLKGTAPKPLHAMLTLNAGLGFFTRGVVKNIRAGVEKADRVIRSGAAYEKFLEYKNFTICLHSTPLSSAKTLSR